MTLQERVARAIADQRRVGESTRAHRERLAAAAIRVVLAEVEDGGCQADSEAKANAR